MKRRNFLKATGLAGLSGMLSLHGAPVAAAPYAGRLLVTVHAEGGIDVTSFCDPKLNVPGEQEINHWARTQEIQSAGSINYAPYGSNAQLFNNYHNYMLVINGIDAQTNSHTTGVVHNWSGRAAAGYPSLGAIFSASQAPNLPLSYITNGGYSETAKLIRYSRVDNTDALINILDPNVYIWNANERVMWDSAYERISAFSEARLQRLVEQGGITPRMKYNRSAYLQSLQQGKNLSTLSENISSVGELQGGFTVGGWEQYFFRQIQLAMISFNSGVASSADLILNGFDTHQNHDRDHEPLTSHFAEGIVYLWEQAELYGLADRLTVVIGTDFGRTPHYNSDNGKDHWPIGSVIVMEKNAPWGNRVVGLTDGGHNAASINPATLQEDNTNGTIIYPKHIHKALREYLGVHNASFMSQFQLGDAEDFDFFNPSIMTAGRDVDPRHVSRIV